VDGKTEEWLENGSTTTTISRLPWEDFVDNLRTILVHRYQDADVQSVQKTPVNGGV
jgi:hypothetical protein